MSKLSKEEALQFIALAKKAAKETGIRSGAPKKQ